MCLHAASQAAPAPPSAAAVRLLATNNAFHPAASCSSAPSMLIGPSGDCCEPLGPVLSDTGRYALSRLALACLMLAKGRYNDQNTWSTRLRKPANQLHSLHHLVYLVNLVYLESVTKNSQRKIIKHVHYMIYIYIIYIYKICLMKNQFSLMLTSQASSLSTSATVLTLRFWRIGAATEGPIMTR